MNSNSNDQRMMDDLRSHRHAVQILDLVSESGCSTALLVRMLGAPHTELVSALRLLAAYGLLATINPEDWSDPVAIPGSIRLSARGEAAADTLSTPNTHRTQPVRRWRASRDLILSRFAHHATSSPTSPVSG